MEIEPSPKSLIIFKGSPMVRFVGLLYTTLARPKRSTDTLAPGIPELIATPQKSSPNTAPSARIVGGVYALIEAIHKKLKCPVVLSTEVLELTQIADKIDVKTNKESYEVDYVVSTLPPRLAAHSIIYNPELSKETMTQFKNIPTWMGYAAKCVIEFEDAFWREEGLSGFAFSHVGPLGEIHDACTKQSAALFGFLSSNAKLENIEEQVVNQLVRVYGTKASKPKNIYVIDWKKQKYTSTLLDTKLLFSVR